MIRSNEKACVRVRPEHGVALVIVLAALVILLVIAVGFLGRVRSERVASRGYSSAVASQMLAEKVVSLVQAQISHATTKGEDVPWASQPGMIRTFQPDGSLKEAFKLYSDDSMVVSAVDVAAISAGLVAWSTAPSLFTDLNAPVTDAAGMDNFPILNPAAVSRVAGFSVAGAPGATARQPIPMPVRWLYMLRDGSLQAGVSGDPGTAVVPAATEENPIVARVAFWTDDDTCKLNINTASHGDFWDIPRAFSFEERDRMARFQPALREFQRYPGHPATTSLRPVFGYKFPDEDAFRTWVYGPEADLANPGVAPRIQAGGSLAGTRFAPAAVALDSARLYSTVDELLLSPARLEIAGFTKQDLGIGSFFLTAISRAPEVNLFQRPRMAVWPINSGSKTPSSLDRLIAFCSTINGVPYYLKRRDPTSQSSDFASESENQKLYDYIGGFFRKPFPGFGAESFADKFTVPECDQIETLIFDYIRSSNLYSTYGGASAYTAGNPNAAASGVGQVVPLQIGSTRGAGRFPVLTRAMLQFYVAGARAMDGTEYVPSTAGPAPKYSGDARFGEFQNFLNSVGEGNVIKPLIRGIVYFDAFDPMYGYPYPRYRFEIDVRFSGGWSVNGVPLGFPASAAINVRRDHNALYHSKSDGFVGTYLGGFLGGWQGPLWIMQNYRRVRASGVAAGATDYPLVGDLVEVPGYQAPLAAGEVPPEPKLPPHSALPPTALSFSGGTVEVDLKYGSEVIQTCRFQFPAFTKPMPAYADETVATAWSSIALDPLKQFVTSADFRNRWHNNPGWDKFAANSADPLYDYASLQLVQNGDVVVSVEPAYGDKRLLAARSALLTAESYPLPGAPARTASGEVASFVPHKDYFNVARRHAYNFRTAGLNYEQSYTPALGDVQFGKILNVDYGRNAIPDIPSRYSTGVPTLNADGTPGTFPPDFDNGTLQKPDDSYLNRADEGSVFDKLTGTGATSSGSAGRDFAWYSITPGTDAYNSPTFYSPNKQMPSAVMFGSLPTGVVRDLPWQTLLFRPDPGGHPGAGNPPDYLLLDLFWMPVVEPYAISEPFSTAGKVNMNFQILPFAYIERSTALHGVLQSVELMVVENSAASRGGLAPQGYGAADEYKMTAVGGTSQFSSLAFRKKLNIDDAAGTGTLKAFRDLFQDNKIFLSETQICALPLVPEDQAAQADFEQSYWNARRLTGDNSREMPYAHLLPRLTTRSNSYTVHYKVQSLKKKRNSPPSVWNESSDAIVAEARGATSIERFIAPDNPGIPDYPAMDGASPGLGGFYQWRVTSSRAFSP